MKYATDIGIVALGALAAVAAGHWLKDWPRSSLPVNPEAASLQEMTIQSRAVLTLESQHRARWSSGNQRQSEVVQEGGW